jgi:hypothetical protein
MKTRFAPPALATRRLALAAAVLAGCCAGCTTTTYRDPSGATFTRTSFLTKQAVGRVDVAAGDKKLTLEGYATEQTETAAAVAAAVTKALARP